MKKISQWLTAVLGIILLVSVGAIAASDQNLQQSTKQTQATAPKDEATPFEDISGMYSFLREGEFVQINLEEGKLVTGFVSRYGDTDTDKGAFLDQFFSKAALDGKHLTFTTKPVHSIWFEFDGTVERGPGKTPNDEAYRVIHGKLTQFVTDHVGKVSAKSRELEMKSFPQDYADESAAPPKKD